MTIFQAFSKRYFHFKDDVWHMIQCGNFTSTDYNVAVKAMNATAEHIFLMTPVALSWEIGNVDEEKLYTLDHAEFINYIWSKEEAYVKQHHFNGAADADA